MVNNATNVPRNAVQLPPVIKCTGLTMLTAKVFYCSDAADAAAADNLATPPPPMKIDRRAAGPKRVKRRRRLSCHQGTGLLLGWIPRRRITNVVE